MNVCKTIPFPIQNDTLSSLEKIEEFEYLIDKAMEQKPYLVKYLTDLDAKSPSTFNHSVLVALNVHNRLCKDMTLDDIKQIKLDSKISEYTIAALVHDAGKLCTPDLILHSADNFKNVSHSEGNKRMAIMHRHSIDGLGVAKEYGFSKEETSAVVLHHVDSIILDGAPQNGFNGAELSRDSWVQEFGKGYVDQMLFEECGWMNKEDVQMIKEISFCDVVEALRTTERAYNGNKSKEWFAGEEGLAPSVYSIVMMDVANGKMDDKFLDIVKDNSFRREFDFMENSGIENRVRSLVIEKATSLGIDISVDLSKDDDMQEYAMG